jgi:hypothetical protein
MKPRPRLLLATTFAFALVATAASTLVATARIAEAGAPARPSGARLREAPALAPIETVHSLFLARRYAEAIVDTGLRKTVFVDSGIEVSSECIKRLFLPRIHAYVRGEGGRDYKTSLQELASQGVGSLPNYKIAERGPDHEKRFTATVYLAGKAWGSGEGRSKKEAEQQAAHEAFDALSARAARPAGATRETAAKG